MQSQGKNIAIGKHAEQSSFSQWSVSFEEAARAVSGAKTGGFAFHMDLEEMPWWRLDLQNRCYFDRIVVYNRINFSDRAKNLEILISDDGKLWRSLYTHNGQSFGGVNGLPLEIECGRTHARFIEIRILERQYLHLDQVEVYDDGLIYTSSSHENQCDDKSLVGEPFYLRPGPLALTPARISRHATSPFAMTKMISGEARAK
jgi:hypothetical protein